MTAETQEARISVIKPERRLKDVEEENAELKSQMQALLQKMAAMEEVFSSRVGKIKDMHMTEMEALTRNHMDQTDHLAQERDELQLEVERLSAEVKALNEKLEGVTETAAYVTNMASSLEDIKETHESTLETYRRKVKKEKSELITQLSESQMKLAETEGKLMAKEIEYEALLSRLGTTESLMEDLKRENEDLRERVVQSKSRNFSIASLLSNEEKTGSKWAEVDSDFSRIHLDDGRMTPVNLA